MTDSRRIVVADTSPLNYLIQIDCIDLVRDLYDGIIIPLGVSEELLHRGAPRAVNLWAANLPVWVDVCLPRSKPDQTLDFLGRGEREAIQIALEQHAYRILIDEFRGRIEAERRGLTATGTLGILIGAARLRLIDPEAAYRRLLLETSFRSSPALEAAFREQVRKQT